MVDPALKDIPDAIVRLEKGQAAARAGGHPAASSQGERVPVSKSKTPRLGFISAIS